MLAVVCSKLRAAEFALDISDHSTNLLIAFDSWDSQCRLKMALEQTATVCGLYPLDASGWARSF
jgi:hypothetical protein